MMMVSINCDRCLSYFETKADHGDASSVIDRELDPGWAHVKGVDYCPNCAPTLVK